MGASFTRFLLRYLGFVKFKPQTDDICLSKNQKNGRSEGVKEWERAGGGAAERNDRLSLKSPPALQLRPSAEEPRFQSPSRQKQLFLAVYSVFCVSIAVEGGGVEGVHGFAREREKQGRRRAIRALPSMAVRLVDSPLCNVFPLRSATQPAAVVALSDITGSQAAGGLTGRYQ